MKCYDCERREASCRWIDFYLCKRCYGTRIEVLGEHIKDYHERRKNGFVLLAKKLGKWIDNTAFGKWVNHTLGYIK